MFDNKTEKKQPNKFRLGAFISYLILGLFIVLVFSGISLYISPTGSIARGTDWKWIFLSRDSWRCIHIIFCAFFVGGTLLHIYLHRHIIFNWLKAKIKRRFNTKKELILAILVVMLLFLFALGQWWPLSQLFHLRNNIKYREDIPDGACLFKGEEPGQSSNIYLKTSTSLRANSTSVRGILFSSEIFENRPSLFPSAVTMI